MLGNVTNHESPEKNSQNFTAHLQLFHTHHLHHHTKKHIILCYCKAAAMYFQQTRFE